MNITFILIALIACVVSVVLGLTAGINLNPSSTVKYVWAWGSAGDWVSGVGALIAVLSTLYLHKRNEAQQAVARKDQITIEQGAPSSHALMRFTSHGHFTSKVRGVLLTKNDGGSISLFGHDLTGTEQKLPQYLGFKDDFQLEWHVSKMRPLLMAINTLQCTSIDDLSVEVLTSVDAFVFPLDIKVKALLREVAAFEQIRIEN